MSRSADLLANLYVVLAVQHPGGEFLLRGAWYAPQTFRVKGQAHDRLRVGFDLAQHGPLGYIPQQQRTILISSQQERSDTQVWLEEEENDWRGGGGTSGCEEGTWKSSVSEDVKGEFCCEATETTVWCWKLRGAEVIILEAPADTQETLWAPFVSLLLSLSRTPLHHSSLYSSSIFLSCRRSQHNMERNSKEWFCFYKSCQNS